MRVLAVEADTNDADYATETTDISNIGQEELDNLRRIFAIVAATDCEEGGNWNNQQEVGMSGPTPARQYKGKLSKKDIALVEKYIPAGEYGIHTISSVRILDVVETLLG